MDKKVTDRYGHFLRIGDTVRLIDIPLELFLLRTEPDQNILRAEIGRAHFVQEIDQHGKIRLEFYDKFNLSHNILISASCVVKI